MKRMKKGAGNWLLLILPLCFGLPNVGGLPAGSVRINELLLINNSIGVDPDYREYSGWVELYNPSDNPLPLDGLVLTDGSSGWSIPAEILIDGRSFLLFWFDE